MTSLRKTLCIVLVCCIVALSTGSIINVHAAESAGIYTEFKLGKEYTAIGQFSEGLAWVRIGLNYGYIDKTGREVIPCIYESAFNFSEGLAMVKRNGQYGFIDIYGEEVIECKYGLPGSSGEYFQDGLVNVRTSDGIPIFLKKNGEIISLGYIAVGMPSEGRISVMNESGKWGYIDFDGNEVIPCTYNSCGDFSEGLASAKLDNHWYAIDAMGNVVFELNQNLDAVFEFSDGLAEIASNRKHGFINKSGKIIIPLEYDYANNFSGGLACVEKDGKYGYIDRNGIAITPTIYDRAETFIEDRAIVWARNSGYGVIDTHGKEVVPCKYSRIWDYSDGLARVAYANSAGYYKYGFIDKNGMEILPVEFDNASDYSENTITVKKDSKWFLLSLNETEYIYNTTDPGEMIELPIEMLVTVINPSSASKAVNSLTSTMTSEQKASATGTDLATLYAETAVSKVASKKVTGKEIIINKAAVSDLEAVAVQTSSAVETALVNGGVTTARMVSNTVTLTTDETGEITIKLDPDILTTQVDKIRVETPTYAITLKVADLKEDLTEILTITAQDMGSGFAAGNQSKKTTVKVNLPKGKTSNPVTLSLPTESSDTTYQAVVKTDGSATSSKYNPATTTMDGKVNTSGSYTVQTNQKDFTDIANKSAEMQKAIRYLASKGIINGTSATEFSPDGSINRAEIAALLVRALGKLDNSATNSFTDVKSSDWYYATAGSSQKCGLIKGYTDNTFRGTTPIIKDQILAVAARVLKNEMGYKEPSNPASYLAKYSDTVTVWAQPEVALATKENLVVYRVDGTFKGANNMTRGDAAIIIYRLFQKIW